MIINLQELKKYKANKASWDKNTKETKIKTGKIKGLYFLFDVKNTIAYIGKSNDIRQRLRVHLFYEGHYNISKVKRGEICFFSFYPYQANDLRQIEKKQIDFYKPRMNSPYDLKHYGYKLHEFDSLAQKEQFEKACLKLYNQL